MSNRDQFPKDYDILCRSYLVDPKATERELIARGRSHVATYLSHDYRMGRLAENYGHLTGMRVVVEPLSAGLAGAASG